MRAPDLPKLPPPRPPNPPPEKSIEGLSSPMAFFMRRLSHQPSRKKMSMGADTVMNRYIHMPGILLGYRDLEGRAGLLDAVGQSTSVGMVVV